MQGQAASRGETRVCAAMRDMFAISAAPLASALGNRPDQGRRRPAAGGVTDGSGPTAHHCIPPRVRWACYMLFRVQCPALRRGLQAQLRGW